MGSQDGSVLGTTKIVDKGPNSDCFTIVLVAEGYTKSQQPDFEKACNAFVKEFTAISPYNDCSSAINIHRINVASTESGADDPKTPDCNGPGTTAKTYFDASYCNGQIRRLMSFDSALAIKVLNAQVPHWDCAMLLVNSSEGGGAGGQVAISSTGPGWTSTALHEFGHSLGLGDEYPTWFGCPGLTENAYFHHSATEPTNPNLTIQTDRSKIKWRTFIKPTTKLPTTVNADCTRCDPQPSPVPPGTVGLFEGAHYCHCGAYRPEYDCLMRTLGVGYCAVCRAWLRHKIASYINQPDLAITPWGYAQEPPTSPYWSSPDIWGSPKAGQAKNDLHIRVRNVGKAAAPPFKVRVSFVPFTGVVDPANEILIGEVARPGLGAMATDAFIVNWDLSPANLPAKYSNFEHFCVIAEIKATECNTTNNSAQSNFTIVKKPTSGQPPPLMFEIANPWDHDAELAVELVSHDRQMRIHPIDFDPVGMTLRAGERRPVRVAFELTPELAAASDEDAAFDITQRLDGQLLGGMSGVVAAERRDARREVTCPRCGATSFVYQVVSETSPDGVRRAGDVIISCAHCGHELLHAEPTQP